MRRVKLFVWISAVCLLFTGAAVLAGQGEIGFAERFALAKDRERALAQLVPGTEEYYYYHCLYLQQQGKLGEVERLLPAWIKRHGHTRLVREIQNRQALLGYDRNPRRALDYLRRRLNVDFRHARVRPGQKPRYPTRLDPDRIAPATLRRLALARHRHDLRGFTDRGLYLLDARRLGPYQLRDLLKRLRRPDLPDLARLVAQDLANRHSRGFGSLPIHRALTLQQLQELGRLRRDLAANRDYVNAVLLRLRPSGYVDWRHDAKARQAYLERLWAFVGDLPPVHNSLKASVLYQRLLHDRRQGVFDRKRFIAYLKLPRNLFYVNPVYLRASAARRFPVNLRESFSSLTLFPAIGNDEPLVRGYLEHFFATSDDLRPFAPYVREKYLKRVLAQTRVLAGDKDTERWVSLLTPQEFKQLRERVEIDFLPGNKTWFRAEDPVRIKVRLKNVKTLIVKVFAINTVNYYKQSRVGDGSDINLDGLVANAEKVHSFKVSPLLRVEREFDFPALKQPGLYIIDFIGNGRSNRVIVRKGRLRYLQRVSTAGQVLTILDENNRVQTGASVWLAGHEYRADEQGRVLVPFSTAPGETPMVMISNGFACLDAFGHQGENYTLRAGMHLDRESLRAGARARLLVRPVLLLDGEPVTLSVLKEVELLVRATDIEGVATTTRVDDFKLYEDRESVYTFTVPEHVTRLAFTLRAKVQPLTRTEKITLTAGRAFAINGIDRSSHTVCLHLSRAGGGYRLYFLGKNGEPLGERPVRLTLKHRDFRYPAKALLQTDDRGVIELGKLPGIVRVAAAPMQGPGRSWDLQRDRGALPRVVCAPAGKVLRVPYLGSAARPDRAGVSLFELRAGSYCSDRTAAVAIKDGFLQIAGLEPGDYRLHVRDTDTDVRIHIDRGRVVDGFLAGEGHLLQLRRTLPLQIAGIDNGRREIIIHLANADRFTRVHVFATTFLPAFDAFADLDCARLPAPARISLPKVDSDYLAGRDIGDEYRYILERRYARKFPGNMLPRPGLLLNPWAVQKTAADRDRGRQGGRFGYRRAGGGRKAAARGGGGRATGAGGDFANLDFLATGSALKLNLKPDANGKVTLKRADLGEHAQVTVVAVGPQDLVCRRAWLPAPMIARRDLRLQRALDPARHFSQQKAVSVLRAGGRLVIEDITSSRLQVYDSLAGVYGLYTTLNPDPKLAAFSFLPGWKGLAAARKRELYSRYACHELNFFIFHKDPRFFAQVVKPYLANKKDKTFMDEWLLGRDLARFLDPWAYARLNIVEKILLARRVAQEREAGTRYVRDRFDLLPPDPERRDYLFRVALRGRSLEAGGGLEPAGMRLDKKLLAHESPVAVDSITGTSAFARSAPSSPMSRNAGRKARARKRRDELKEKMEKIQAEVSDHEETAEDEVGAAFFKRDASLRRRARALYRKLDQTREWAENNYYHLRVNGQTAGLVKVNAFWRDYAAHRQGPFVSGDFAQATGGFTEMALALGVLDLPFTAAKHEIRHAGKRLTLLAGSPMVVFHQEVKPAAAPGGQAPVLISQNCFLQGDRYRYEGNEKVDKFVFDEFMVGKVYGCQVVVTNPTSSRRRLELLLQIPQGALPVNGGLATRGLPLRLEPYATSRIEYFFYFPRAGKFAQYPAHVALAGKVVAAAKAASFRVVDKPATPDKDSWEYVSQFAPAPVVLAFLARRNLGRVKLARMAWRMRDQGFFTSALAILRKRHAYDNTLWSYGILHNDRQAIAEYLRHQEAFLDACGAWLESPLLTLDPVARGRYEHLEYAPLVNARAHRFGRQRKILNPRLHAQYHRFLRLLCCRNRLTDQDHLDAAYYLLLQDRVREALAQFEQVDARKLSERLQYDYLRVYLDFYTENLARARALAARYRDYPVKRWRKRFAEVLAQLDEIQGKGPRVVDAGNRTQTQTALAAGEPGLDLQMRAGELWLTYANLTSVRVNYYQMDIEQLFSRHPFMEQHRGQFAYILPTFSRELKLSPDKTQTTIELPARFKSANLVVEVTCGQVTRSLPCFSNQLELRLSPNYGQLQVLAQGTGAPLPRVYVKTYARMRGGKVRFYKDGYTDLRGRFDYSSLNTNELEQVERFAILVMSEKHGSLIREAAAPKR